MKTEFDIWWGKSPHYVPGNNYVRSVAEAAWLARGISDAGIAQRLNCPRAAGAIAADLPRPEYEVGQVHD